MIGIRWEERKIEYVEPDSPAEIAGLTIGDIIFAVDGEETETDEEIRTRMRAGPMVYVNLTIDRDWKLSELKIGRIAYAKMFGTPGK